MKIHTLPKKSIIYTIIGIFLLLGLSLFPFTTSATQKITNYTFIIITPPTFINQLNHLVIHKENHALPTKIIALDDIYNSTYFPTMGRDHPEQIKYFIKNTLENWSTHYIMLVGNKEQLPVRYVDICSWDEHFTIISDLYYADIYDENGSFCSWDSNNDSIFAGQSMDGMVDKVDLDPDVALGRILCTNQNDVQKMVEKIISYENTTYGESWFNNFIICGGDFAELWQKEIFLPKRLNRTGGMVWEGEYLGNQVAKIMTGFTAKKIYATGLFKPKIQFLSVKNINNALNEGAGFILFMGHGTCQCAMKTNFPLCKKIWLPYPNGYRITDTQSLTNTHKLPIAIFLGCNCGDFDTNTSPIAWELVKKEHTGAIASFAATTGSIGIFSSLFAQSFTPLLIKDTFTSYAEGITIMGDIWKNVLHSYLQNQDAWELGDQFSEFNWHHPLANILVLEEWILLGDPTLKIGGYP